MSARAKVVEVRLPDGEVIHAEVLPAGGGDVSALDRLELRQASDMVRKVGSWAATAMLSSLPRRPDEFEVSFGLKLGAKSGKLIGILAEASGEATFTVRMKWGGGGGDQPAADPS